MGQPCSNRGRHPLIASRPRWFQFFPTIFPKLTRPEFLPRFPILLSFPHVYSPVEQFFEISQFYYPIIRSIDSSSTPKSSRRIELFLFPRRIPLSRLVEREKFVFDPYSNELLPRSTTFIRFPIIIRHIYAYKSFSTITFETVNCSSSSHSILNQFIRYLSLIRSLICLLRLFFFYVLLLLLLQLVSINFSIGFGFHFLIFLPILIFRNDRIDYASWKYIGF